MSDPIPTKGKRGRKSKQTLADEAAAAAAAGAASTNQETIENSVIASLETDVSGEAEADLEAQPDSQVVVKKRGRKPKGGKIIQQPINLLPTEEEKVNVILHLKCSLKDLHQPFNSTQVDSFNSYSDLSYEVLLNESKHIYINKDAVSDEEYSCSDNVCYKESDTKELWKKIKQLEHRLHINNISDKKSACFWCTYEFDNPPIYIPKHFLKDSYHVYGCFCSPECSVAYLMEENIDSSTKFERYHLLNHIYAKIYDYTKNIKPAPNPYYMLDKYYGNLTIQEYRALLSNDRLFLIVNKPLTRIMPELHQDNEDFIINNKIIPTNNYNVKKKLQKKTTQNKSTILNEQFGISQNCVA